MVDPTVNTLNSDRKWYGWTIAAIVLVILLGIALRLPPPEKLPPELVSWPSPYRELRTIRPFLGVLPLLYVVVGSIAGIALAAASFMTRRSGTLMRLASLVVMTAVWAPGLLIAFAVGTVLGLIRVNSRAIERSNQGVFPSPYTPLGNYRQGSWKISNGMLIGVFLFCWIGAIVILGAHFESNGYDFWWNKNGRELSMLGFGTYLFFLPIYLAAIRDEVQELRGVKKVFS